MSSTTKTKNSNVRLTDEEARAIEQQAARLGVSKSDVFRMLCRGVMPTLMQIHAQR
jgi:hypothetical protein